MPSTDKVTKKTAENGFRAIEFAVPRWRRLGRRGGLHLEDLRGTGTRSRPELAEGDGDTFFKRSRWVLSRKRRGQEGKEERKQKRKRIRCFRMDFRRGFVGNSSCQRMTKSGEEKGGSLFLGQGAKVAEVPWRLYRTYFYTEYFNNNNINICKGWPAGGLPAGWERPEATL